MIYTFYMPALSLLRCRKAALFSMLLTCFTLLEIHAQYAKTEILWDRYGVPHIYAKNTREMYYAFGWAQMNNHADLLLRIYGQARGRAAEYWGSAYVNSDKEVLLYDLPGKALKMYQKQTAEYKNYIDAFVKGINDYATAHTQLIGEEFKQVLPITATDVFSHMERVLYRFLTATERRTAEQAMQAGSNAYAIGPSRSASKNAMLVINPHLPWSTEFTLCFEAQLNTQTFHEYGATLVGLPILFLAFNDSLGWTHTVNTLDASDRYELSLQDDGYLLDGQTMPFEKRTVTIRVKEANGTFREENLEIKSSRHGPVFSEKDNKAYVMRIAGLENEKIFEEYHRMGRAKNLSEFETALKMLQIPMFNVVYADNAGNILYLFNGNIPKRPEGDFKFWRGIVDGTKSKLIWQETLGYKELPRVLNPPTGFLQNANDPPWICTYPVALDPANFLPYVAPQGMAFRPQRAVNMIRNDISISFDKLISYKLNTGVEPAERFIDDLLAAVAKYPDSTALKAAAVLRSWDKRTDASSKGAVLYSTWFDKITPGMYAIPWDRKLPVSTPDGLKNEQQAVTFLVTAANEVEKKYGAMDKAWGDVYRLRMNGIDLPASGGWQQQGIFMSLSYKEDKDNKYRADGGETFIAVTEFSKPVRAQVLLAYGNATQPGSKHIGDQLELLSRKKLRPAWLSRKDVLLNLEKKETLHMNAHK